MGLFIQKQDFKQAIEIDALDGITDGENDVWKRQLPATIEFVSSYIRHRYDVETIFKPLEKHTDQKTYLQGDRVFVGAKLYNAISDIAIGIPITDTTFWEEKDTRNPMIVEVVLIMVLYNIYTRINGSEIPGWLQVMYDGGYERGVGGKLGWLKEIRKGTVDVDLPLLPNVESGEDQSGNRISFGVATSAINRNNAI